MRLIEVKAIEQITPDEQIELDKLNKEDKHRMLSDKEEIRQIFLSAKALWNCEC